MSLIAPAWTVLCTDAREVSKDILALFPRPLSTRFREPSSHLAFVDGQKKCFFLNKCSPCDQIVEMNGAKRVAMPFVCLYLMGLCFEMKCVSLLRGMVKGTHLDWTMTTTRQTKHTCHSTLTTARFLFHITAT